MVESSFMPLYEEDRFGFGSQDLGAFAGNFASDMEDFRQG